MSVTVFEDFLEKKDFNILKENLLSVYFPWYFNEDSVQEFDSQYQFVNIFYNNFTPNNYFPLVGKVIEKLNPTSIVRIKSNLNTKTEKIVETGEHVDMHADGFKSAVLFINDCNGYCKVGDKKIYSKENKLVMFNSNIKHTGSTCTDKSRRIVINFIFTE
jgi:hypothetical protein|tara:strand:- start:286 stop:765 length:480 start_codon:yes stop_codon:yes gene_type:complete